jgi:hypothetical protein
VIPCTKEITLKAAGTVLMCFNADDVEIGAAEIGIGEEEAVVRVRVILTRDALIDVAAVVRKADAGEVAFVYKPSFGIGKEQIDRLRIEEERMRTRDAYEEQIDVLRNELEAYIFALRAGIEGELQPFITVEEKDKCAEKLAKAMDWFAVNEFERMPLEEYQRELRELKDVGEPVNTRRRAHESWPDICRGWRDRAGRALTGLQASAAVNKEPLIADITAYISRIDGIMEELAEVPKSVMPVFHVKAEEGRIQALEKQVKKLVQQKPKQHEQSYVPETQKQETEAPIEGGGA